MSTSIIQERLFTYQCQSILEQDHALKEIAQEIALMALSRTNFFRMAAFQGGTCLRILHGLPRFSEDLDFVLEEPNPNFSWNKYIENMHLEFNSFGYELEVMDRSKLEKNVKMAFLKANSTGGLLILKDHRNHQTKIKIKLEIDVNPPAGSNYDLKYLDFPLPFGIKVQDLPSLFASKCHALLCRKYVKGRDWFDFVWYVSREIKVNLVLLNHAIEQHGPWQGQNICVDSKWLMSALEHKISEIDWKTAKEDVSRFLKPRELSTLEIWSKDFFLSRLEKLQKTFI